MSSDAEVAIGICTCNFLNGVTLTCCVILIAIRICMGEVLVFYSLYITIIV